ncbi:NAD-dependent epimerase/dehydratase family protein, partial [Neobacillus niacini]|uniref:NAD-dependent epimerase/dehydratase family protein n=1 Tax=Neobacillus niacini TaxID=86668 RepID=UPI002FFF2111
IINNKYIPYEKLMKKTVLITGANGMLAYYFTCVLMHLNIFNNYNIKVIALVRNVDKAKDKFSQFLNNENFKLLPQDVCQPINLSEPVHYILHAAGAASPKFIKNDPVGIINANTIGTLNVMELARHNPVENVLFTSTREIYGKTERIQFITENDMGVLDPLDSRSCYPESKRLAEQLCKSYYLQYGVPFTTVRIAHSYGPGMEINEDGRVMSDFISDVVNNRNIVMKSDGIAERAFCYISDAVVAMLVVMLKGEIGEAYNVANETEPFAIRTVAKKLVDLFPEKGIEVILQESADQSGYCKYDRVGLDTKKVEALGWKPIVGLNIGLKRTVLSFMEESL